MTSAEYYLRCIADLCASMSEAQLERPIVGCKRSG